MNNKKKMVLGAAFVAAIMALAGIGYAAVFSDTYKGTAKSNTQSYDVDYVIVSLGEQSYTPADELYIVYDTATVYNTTTSKEETTFMWLGSTSVLHSVTAKVPTESSTTTDPDDMVLKAEITFSETGYKVQYKTDTTWTDYSTGDISTDGIAIEPGDDVEIYWRIVPTDIGAQEDGGDSGITLTTAVPDTGIVQLPQITYTVIAEQN